MIEHTHWQVQVDQLAKLHTAAQQHHLASSAACGGNVWARLLPPLRRLERWIECRAGQDVSPAWAAR